MALGRQQDMYSTRKNVDCGDAIVEVALVVVFVILATLTSLVVAPAIT